MAGSTYICKDVADFLSVILKTDMMVIIMILWCLICHTGLFCSCGATAAMSVIDLSLRHTTCINHFLETIKNIAREQAAKWGIGRRQKWCLERE